MTSLSLVNELFRYNYWARDRQLQACAAVSQEDFVRPITTSFPSLRDTLAHLVGAEWLWLERWKQRHPTALPAASEFPRLALLEKHWRAVAESVQKGTLRIVRSPSRTPPRASRRSR